VQITNINIRVIPAIDQWPVLVRLSQHASGKVLLLMVFAFGLHLHDSNGLLQMILILAAMSFWPQFRRPLLTVGTIYWLISQHTNLNWDLLRNIFDEQGLAITTNWFSFWISLIVTAILFCALFHYLVQRSHGTWLYRRPVTTLLVGYVVLLTIASYAPLSPIQQAYLWGFLIVLGRFLWYLGYTLLDRNAVPGTKFIYQLGHYLPFWGGSSTPFPKGAAYLRKIEAKNAEELAISQLKGIKLIFWAFFLYIILRVFEMVVYGKTIYNVALPIHLNIPSFWDAFTHAQSGESYPWYINWAVVLANFLKGMLSLSIWGHIIIATCRMAGFKALRNTWRPLQSKTIAEFWNRYYYYFKELLVEFFFYPTYLRFFKTKPRLRMFMATMAAAGMGNVLYHFIRDIDYIVKLGIWEALMAFQVYLFYGLLLGTAIGLSQLRNQNRKQNTHWLNTYIAAPITVIGFYCILHIFDSPNREYGLNAYFTFLMSMINVGTI